MRRWFLLITALLSITMPGCQSATMALTDTAHPSPTATLPLPTAVAIPSITATSSPQPTGTARPSPLPAAPTITPFTPAQRIVIIEYHQSTFTLSASAQMQTDWFEEQMRWIAENGYHTLSVDEIAAFLKGEPVPAESIALTFNIGTAERNDYDTIIMPALRKYHLKATFFLLVNDSVVLDECGSANRFCWQELRQWQAEGLISVQSHGRTHVSYPKASKELVKADAGESKAIIEEKLGTPVFVFAYPSDATSPHAIPVLQQLGYQFALAGNTRADRAIRPHDPDLFTLPRIYPYSNPLIYPALTGANGQTFAEVIRSVLAQP